jgi:hypothetical protein
MQYINVLKRIEQLIGLSYIFDYFGCGTVLFFNFIVGVVSLWLGPIDHPNS